MMALLPLILTLAIILFHQKRWGRPSYLAHVGAAYLLAAVVIKLPWFFD